jgi:hypothetical protein
VVLAGVDETTRSPPSCVAGVVVGERLLVETVVGWLSSELELRPSAPEVPSTCSLLVVVKTPPPLPPASLPPWSLGSVAVTARERPSWLPSCGLSPVGRVRRAVVTCAVPRFSALTAVDGRGVSEIDNAD